MSDWAGDEDFTGLNLEAASEGLSTTGERFGAAWDQATIQTDAWNYWARKRAEVLREAGELAYNDDGAFQRYWDERGGSEAVAIDGFLEGIQASDTVSPQFKGTIPPNYAAARAEADRRVQREWGEAGGILRRAPEGGWVPEFAGGLARAATDEAGVATGVAGLFTGGAAYTLRGLAGVMAVEAGLGAAGELATIPAQQESAARLGTEEPDVLKQVGAAGAISAALPLLGYGVKRGVQYGFSTRELRRARSVDADRNAAAEVDEGIKSPLGMKASADAHAAAARAVNEGDLSSLPPTQMAPEEQAAAAMPGNTQNTVPTQPVVGASRVLEAGKGYTVIEVDGQAVRRVGSRNWRNHNPGNIEYGSFARWHGAIGTDGRFAVFPDYETGRAAKASLLFESGSYRNLSIRQAIARYAPAFENNTAAYAGTVARDVGVSLDTRLSDLTASQRISMLDSMERVEGFKVGKEVLADGTTRVPEHPTSTSPSTFRSIAPDDVGTMTYVSVRPGDVMVDADAYQFKGGINDAGEDGTLAAIKKWNDLYAGDLMFHERLDGRIYVADGHQRHGAAARLEAAGHEPINLRGAVYREADGWTTEQVMAEAAKRNIAQGSGDALDQARILRAFPDEAGDLAGNARARDAMGLAKLSDEAFGAVVNGKIEPRFAGVIGEATQNPREQMAIMQSFIRRKPSNMDEARFMASDAVRMGFSKGDDGQASLFGDAFDILDTKLEDRAKVANGTERYLRTNRSVFRSLTLNASLAEAGGNRLNRAGNAAAADEAAELLDIIGRLATRRGPVSDALDAAAAIRREQGDDAAVELFVNSLRSGEIQDLISSEAVYRSGRSAQSPDAPSDGPPAPPELDLATDHAARARAADAAYDRAAEITGRAADGDQILIDGVDHVSGRQRLEAAQNAPMHGGDAISDDGLFAVDKQDDLFDPETVAMQQELIDAARRDATVSDIPFEADGRSVTARQVIADLDDDTEFLAQLNLCKD